MRLKGKSITELRGMAQSFGVQDIFTKTDLQLIQAIEMKQEAMQPVAPIVIPKPEYDARLMTKPPSRKSNQEEIEALLTEHVARGLKLSFSEEQWFMHMGKKSDEGTIRMPLKTVLHCANEMLRGN